MVYILPLTHHWVLTLHVFPHVACLLQQFNNKESIITAFGAMGCLVGAIVCENYFHAIADRARG